MPALKGSFSFIVAKRMVSALEENGPMIKTNLAIHCRLNYNVCIKYVNMLQLLGWVDIRHDKRTQVTITKRGSEVNARLFQYTGSDPGKELGSVQLEKPVADLPPPRTAARAKRDSVQAGRDAKAKTNIMLVDDESDILLTYRSFLSPSGYNVEGFSDPYSALEKVASSRPYYFDLIVLDIRMPGINGLQLYQSLRVMSPASKFLFVSSLDAARELVTILPGVGQEQVLQKPIDKDYFVKTVKSILAR